MKQLASDNKLKFEPQLRIRADKNAQFRQIHAVMTEAKNIGYQVSVAAMTDEKSKPKK
jgi:biopolymer transport protein ExbD